jgi:DNA-binding helix-hairpin-helix protein with protein kinase domain
VAGGVRIGPGHQSCYRRLITEERLSFDPSSRLAEGGEGTIYAVDGTDTSEGRMVAKIYHRPGADQARKLAAMIAHPPPRAQHPHHEFLAWPTDLLCAENEERTVVGFIMPRIEAAKTLADVHNPAGRRRCLPRFTYAHVVRVAKNLSMVVAHLHEHGYVVGDLSESNVLVNEDSLVTLVDTDSFQVRDLFRGTTFRCRVGRPEVTAPELTGHTFASQIRRPEHDLFALGVLLFRLLMEGTHPFAEVSSDVGEAPSIGIRIARGGFPYGRHSGGVTPVPGAPSFSSLTPLLRAHFVTCFRDGHRAPTARPSARAWQEAIEAAERGLVSCRENARHVYGVHLETCPWCVRTISLGGRDPFATHISPLKPCDPWNALVIALLDALDALATSCDALSTALIAALALPSTGLRARLLRTIASIPRLLLLRMRGVPADRLAAYARRWGRRIRPASARSLLCRIGAGA